MGSLQWGSWVNPCGRRRWSAPPSLHSCPAGTRSADCRRPADKPTFSVVHCFINRSNNHCIKSLTGNGNFLFRRRRFTGVFSRLSHDDMMHNSSTTLANQLWSVLTYLFMHSFIFYLAGRLFLLLVFVNLFNVNYSATGKKKNLPTAMCASAVPIRPAGTLSVLASGRDAQLYVCCSARLYLGELFL